MISICVHSLLTVFLSWVKYFPKDCLLRTQFQKHLESTKQCWRLYIDIYGNEKYGVLPCGMLFSLLHNGCSAFRSVDSKLHLHNSRLIVFTYQSDIHDAIYTLFMTSDNCHNYRKRKLNSKKTLQKNGWLMLLKVTNQNMRITESFIHGYLGIKQMRFFSILNDA